MYFLYILKCRDGTLYTGISVDLARRIREHNTNSKGAKYTRSRRPVKLVYSKKYRNRSTVSVAESRLKDMARQEKLSLVQGSVRL